MCLNFGTAKIINGKFIIFRCLSIPAHYSSICHSKPPIFLAHLSLLRVSFWDTAVSVVRRTCGRRRSPSVNFIACVHSRGNSFDPKFMKLCQNVNHHNI